MHPLTTLNQLPNGYVEAAGLIDGIDRCLLVGFSRLGPDQQTALANLTRSFSGTSLGTPLSVAVEAINRGEFRENHFAVVAAARAALQGSQYDALRKQVTTALGRPFDPAADEPPPPKLEGAFATWGESTRHWLTEIALTGFKQLETSALLPFSATLENMEAEPRTVRQAALLAGFQNELLQSLPVSALPEVPLHRWADLWTRGMIGSYRMPATSPGTKVSGSLLPLGAECRSHASFAAYVVYGILETKGAPPRFVRVNLTTYKVDALRGREVWRSFSVTFKPLLRALAEGGTVTVKDCTLNPTGDLLWDGNAEEGPRVDVVARAIELLGPTMQAFPAAAADRHPVQLAEPVTLVGAQLKDNALSLPDGIDIPLLPAALPLWLEITSDELKNAEQIVALLRFDAGQWHVQPLAVQTGGKKPARFQTGSGAWAEINAKKKTDTLAILKERASRLLRQKK